MRMAQSRNVYRRRRLAALGALAAAAALAGAAVGAGGGGDDPGRAAASRADAAAKPAPKPKRPPELPLGGRTIFPHYRVVAYYGAPQSHELGALGIGSPDAAGRRLRKQAAPYARKTRPVLLAFELIATVANAAPGEDGLYRTQQSNAVIRRYLRAARRAKALLGSVDAAKVNEVSQHIAKIVRERNLPQKLFVVHQFTPDMIRGKPQVVQRPGLATTMNVDGFGDRANKVSKYRQFTHDGTHFRRGYKLFYEEDVGLMKPRSVLALQPPPDLVVYE
jgi:hypothetical protein